MYIKCTINSFPRIIVSGKKYTILKLGNYSIITRVYRNVRNYYYTIIYYDIFY